MKDRKEGIPTASSSAASSHGCCSLPGEVVALARNMQSLPRLSGPPPQLCLSSWGEKVRLPKGVAEGEGGSAGRHRVSDLGLSSRYHRPPKHGRETWAEHFEECMGLSWSIVPIHNPPETCPVHPTPSSCSQAPFLALDSQNQTLAHPLPGRVAFSRPLATLGIFSHL